MVRLLGSIVKLLPSKFNNSNWLQKCSFWQNLWGILWILLFAKFNSFSDWSACGYQEILDGKTGQIYQTNEISRINEIKTKIYKHDNTLTDKTKTFYSIAEYKKRKKLMLDYFLSVQPEELH